MAQQKALRLLEPKGALKVISIDVPKPGPGDVLIKVISAALNPVDWKIQQRGIFVEKYPASLGTDIAGVIEEVGEGVTAFKKGDKVLHEGWLTNDNAGFQQYTIVPAEIAAKIPDNISFDEAASVPLCIFTAAVGLYDPASGNHGVGLTPPWEPNGAGKYNGQGILVIGGSSSVGQFVLQLARLSGFSPIVTTASLHNAEYVKSLGATHVIDRKADVVAEAGKIFSTPPGIVYDAISDDQEVGWKVLAPNGTLILVVSPKPELISGENGKKFIHTFGSAHMKRDLGRSLFSKLTELLQSGDIKPSRVEVLPGGLVGIPAGLKRLVEGQVSALKLIARPQETARVREY